MTGPFQIKLPDFADYEDEWDEDFSLYLYDAEMCSSKNDPYPMHLKKFVKLNFKYEDDGQVPPFTTRQLIAMVLLSGPTPGSRRHFEDCIVRTVFYAFQYYHSSTDQIEINRKQRELTQAIGEELEVVDSPFIGSLMCDHGGGGHTPRTWIEIRHDMKDHALHGTVPATKFDFLRLPPELRSRIYQYALNFESLALHGPHWKRSPEFRRCFCPGDDRHAFDTEVNGRPIACADPNKLLGLLSVNRQIYQEACPVFYGDNKFEFFNMTGMHSFLRAIGPFRRGFIRDVEVIYGRAGDWSKDAKIAKAAFKLLSEALPLRSFTLYFIEDYVFGTLRNPKITKPEHVPGLSFLHETFRGIPKLSFIYCPQVQEYLTEVMGKPAGEEEKQVAKKDMPVLTSKRSLRPKKSIQYTETDSVD